MEAVESCARRRKLELLAADGEEIARRVWHYLIEYERETQDVVVQVCCR